jgi:hypothetical protein
VRVDHDKLIAVTPLLDDAEPSAIGQSLLDLQQSVAEAAG